jgi:Leucine-rich repeat (LRR) protein
MKTILTFILSITLLFNNSFAQTTTIPDAAFELKLIQLGIDSDGLVNGQILNSDAVGISYLNVSNSNIVDMTGIGAFVDLDTLHCEYNNTYNLDVSSNTNLKFLFCHYSYITDLDASGNPSLIKIQGNNNNLTSLNISGASSLTSLQCASNSLTSLDVSGNLALEELSCYNNNLTSLDVSNNTNLNELICSDNNLTSLDVSGSPFLTQLFCNNNDNLISLNVLGVTSLEELNCHNSKLTSLDVSTNLSLRYLNCYYSDLISLDISNNINLTRLNCSNNTSLVNLSLLGASSLSSVACNDNINLTSLDLSGTTSLNDLSCNDNTSLASLNISGNPNLTIVECYRNGLTTLNISGALSLTHLDCSSNSLISLDVSGSPNLSYLNCSSNSITSLDLLTNLNLHVLDCGGNNIGSLDLSRNLYLSSLYCSYCGLSSLDLTGAPLLQTLNCENNNLRQLNLISSTTLFRLYGEHNHSGLQICVFNVQKAIDNNYWAKDSSAIYTNYCYPLSVKGKVVIEDNSNCIADSIEGGLSGQLVQFERLSDTSLFYFRTYDTLGNYNAYVDTGLYTVSVIPTGPYWQVCPGSQQVFVDTSSIIQTIDWSLEDLLSCPLLEVDIAAPFLRMTGGGSAYTISYCNNGTIAAQNAYVEVDLDSSLNFVAAGIPIASQSGTTYTFNLGTIGVGVCGSFRMQVIVDTTAQFEQTHCTEVHIYPDSICLPIWSGPIVDGDVNCQNDSILFRIDNIGTGMLQPQPYTVIQDDIAMRIGTVQLGAGQHIIIKQKALQGKTYRIEVGQLTGYPSLLGDRIFSEAIEGCTPFANGTFNVGFMTQFSNGYSTPFKAIDCQPNVGSYDPNDKAAQPEGYGSQHYIVKNSSIDYKIRFQNTGTDTAFNIIIMDSLSTYLDVTSLQMGASSDSYTWEIIDGNVLKVSFSNIMLVDSNANEALSHGFFRYRINQETNNPLGSLIENQAAIYFDYNPPIFTNTTFHTIGEEFVPIVLTIEDLYEEDIEVTAFPNPFDYSTTIKVEGNEYDVLELSVFDIGGRLMTEKQTSSVNQIQLSRGALQAGVYFYKLKGDGKLLNTGKLLVR